MSAECEALAEVEADAADLAAEGGGWAEEMEEEADEDSTLSSLDLILDLLFQRCTLHELQGVAEKKRSLRRMWKSTFGRLPPASDVALKHAPGRPATARTSAADRPVPPPEFRGRLRVPPPPSTGQGASGSGARAGWTKLK